MKTPRWREVTPSEYPHEREALDYVKSRLPDNEPFRAWSNFEFIAGTGTISEVDLLVVSLHKIYLVEIKSWHGTITGDAGTWRRQVGDKTFYVDNPVILANRKAKKFASLLQRQPALRKERVPRVEAVVFLAGSAVRCNLEDTARTGVYLDENSNQGSEPSIVDVLTGNAGFDPHPPRRIERSLSTAIMRAIDQAGIRPSQRQRRVSDYVLKELLLETDEWQDWQAKHVAIDTERRVRIYALSRSSSEAARTELQRAAEREYRLLEGVNHDGILRVEHFTQAGQGPALVFEHDRSAERLDHFLARRHSELDLDTRLNLLRQLAETLKYAHERRLYHRALCPTSVLVIHPDAARPQLKIFDWQAGKYDDTQTSTTRFATQTLLGLADDATDVYLAPESRLGGYLPEKLDVFSLGALGYHLFTGEPPAPNVIALEQRLASEGGLLLSGALDGASDELQVLILEATDPEVGNRSDSVSAFLKALDDVARGLQEEVDEPAEAVHPVDAEPGDLLGHDFLVEQRLGKGSTAIALEVMHNDGRQGVLKIALDPELNDRIREEGEALQTLRHQNVVELYEPIDISGHAALFMAKAGTYTLADRIRDEGQLSLDLLQRFGEQLIEVVRFLEECGVSHRDLKPDNIGISEARSDRALTLVVFDLSLAGTSADNIRAGTPQYLDPFLKLRTPPRWDLGAERFAAAMTLHEMATGNVPTWGDGLSDPALIDDEVSVDAERFDASVRDSLTAFFQKALARDHRQRFDNADEMRRAWFRCFEAIDAPAAGDETGEDLPASFPDVTPATPLGDLGVSPRVMNALERMGAHTVGELMAMPRIRLYRNKGIGQRIVRRIRELRGLLEELLDDAYPVDVAVDPEEDSAIEPQLWSIDMLAGRLVPGRIDPDVARIQRFVAGLAGDLPPLPAHASVAAALGVPATEVAHAVLKARQRWLKQPWMTAVRDVVANLLQSYGGVMTARELADALAGARGSTATGTERVRLSAAVAAAAVETESGRDACRFVLQREGELTLVMVTTALDPELTASPESRGRWVAALAAKADELADADPLVPPARVFEALAKKAPPPGQPALSPERTRQLAVQASCHAVLSSRGELYPRGMAALRALRLGANSLLGPKTLKPRQIRKRIASRYPEAEPLPDRPALDEMLDEAGLGLVWDRDKEQFETPTHRATFLTGTATRHASEDDGAEDMDRRIERVIDSRGFLAISLPPQYLAGTEGYLMDRFGLRVVSLEATLLRHMREAASELNADWRVVVAADAAMPGSPDRRRLEMLVRRAEERLAENELASDEPLLLTRPGLLARYRRLDLLTDAQSLAMDGRANAARILLIVADSASNAPVVDGEAFPVVLNASWTRAGDGWLGRAHARANQRAAVGGTA